jgi:hypothetical protein
VWCALSWRVMWCRPAWLRCWGSCPWPAWLHDVAYVAALDLQGCVHPRHCAQPGWLVHNTTCIMPLCALCACLTCRLCQQAPGARCDDLVMCAALAPTHPHARPPACAGMVCGRKRCQTAIQCQASRWWLCVFEYLFVVLHRGVDAGEAAGPLLCLSCCQVWCYGCRIDCAMFGGRVYALQSSTCPWSLAACLA